MEQHMNKISTKNEFNVTEQTDFLGLKREENAFVIQSNKNELMEAECSKIENKIKNAMKESFLLREDEFSFYKSHSINHIASERVIISTTSRLRLHFPEGRYTEEEKQEKTNNSLEVQQDVLENHLKNG